ncbi:hypothetical protein SDC9_209560 [bioreactor metagenome]|uniref:Uncharacterized protein n=1 Tax=bioreactor metagenome TaxID=1076179 RepID=A0A645JED0_9ZZZZ
MKILTGFTDFLYDSLQKSDEVMPYCFFNLSHSLRVNFGPITNF